MAALTINWGAVVVLASVASLCSAKRDTSGLRGTFDDDSTFRTIRAVDSVDKENAEAEERQDIKEVMEKAFARVMKEALPYVQDLAYDENVPPECMRSIFKIGTGIRRYDFWALKFIDSMGRPPAGFFEGSVGGLGAYDECRSIRVHKQETGEEDFRGQYCSLYVKTDYIDTSAIRLVEKFMSGHPLLRVHLKNIRNTTAFFLKFRKLNNELDPRLKNVAAGLRFGICIPSTCSPGDIKYIGEKLVKKYGIVITVRGCSVEKPVELTGIQIAMVAVLASLSFLVGLSSVIDVYLRHRSRRVPVKPHKRPLLLQVLLAFSAVTNTGILMRTTTPTSSRAYRLRCLHGIRVFSFMWVVLGHTYGAFDLAALGRGLIIVEAIHDPWFSLVLNAVISVQTFFYLSGFLVAEGMLSNRHMPAYKTIPMAIIRRYIRLTIPTLFYIGLFFLYPLVVIGPTADEWLWFMVDNCRNYWWDAMLQSTNYRRIFDMCLPHLWYVSADCQLFLCLIIFVVIMVIKPKYGIPAIAAVTVGGCIALAIQTYVNNYGPLLFTSARGINETIAAIEGQYDKSISYLPAFGIGILSAHFVETYHNVKLRKIVYVSAWLTAWAVGLAVVFGTYPWAAGGPYTNIESSLHMAGHRVGWALCLSWVVFTCSTGQARWVNGLLSHPGFIPVSRLTFAGYLLHVLVIAVKPLKARTAVFLDHWSMVRDFFGNLVITILVSYLFFLICECPVGNLDKLAFLRLTPEKGKANPSNGQLGEMKVGRDEKAVHKKNDDSRTCMDDGSGLSCSCGPANGVACCHL